MFCATGVEVEVWRFSSGSFVFEFLAKSTATTWLTSDTMMMKSHDVVRTNTSPDHLMILMYSNRTVVALAAYTAVKLYIIYQVCLEAVDGWRLRACLESR